MTERATPTSEEILDRMIQLCQEKRAEDLVVLDVKELVDYTDYLLLGSGRSERQNRALCDHVRQSLKHEGVTPLSVAGYEAGSWICLDFVDVVLHLFTPVTRKHYDLELLWGDAKRREVPAPSASRA